MERINKGEQKMSSCNSERRILYTAPCGKTEIRCQHVKSEADKIFENRINELRDRLQRADERLAKQREFLKTQAEERIRQNEIKSKSRAENIARQQRKHLYTKNKLSEAQSQQEKKLKKIDDTKKSLLMQSSCMKMANDMRKYYLKKIGRAHV